MTRAINYFSTLGLVFFLFSCVQHKAGAELDRLPRIKTSELVDLADSLSSCKPNYFYSKISTSYSDSSRNVSFKTSIRMVKDSAINTLITYAAIPIVNAMITTDSVSIVNKKDKCYILHSLSYIKENFGVEFKYRNLEELILGIPLDYDSTQKYHQIHDPNNYTLSSHRKWEIKRYDRNEKLVEREDVIVKYHFTDDLKALKGMYIESPSDSAQIIVEYPLREVVQGYNVPSSLVLNIKTPRKTLKIEFQYAKTELLERQPLFIVIPESYEKCK